MKKFILLIKGEDRWAQLSPAQMQETIQRYSAWAGKLRAENRLVDAEGLSSEGKVLVGGDVITDGPFPETKEMVGGYYIFTAADLAEAETLARECPALAYGGRVELRQAMDYS
ncbi:MAG: YciI family protein [Fimbriimonas sp.]